MSTAERWDLRLYVAGQSPKSLTALTNLKRICKRCQELPGQMLFQYVNGDGEPRAVTSGDVNEYIKQASGGDFTAKHFRTWSASVIALEQLLKKIGWVAMVPPLGVKDK